jgi:hypothetical protein
MPSTGSHRPSLCRSLRRRRFRCRPQHRRGYALVIFALLFFCLMALGALVIDLGLARLTQRQMQSAVDSAALEGLRGRDVDVADPKNLAGRLAATEVIRQTFDDNLNPEDGDIRNFGAGPIYRLGPSIGTDPALAAGQLLSIDLARVYKPTPQLNEDNLLHGDFVAGDLFDDPEGNYEESDYSRIDFEPEQRGNAFLARLRRTNDRDALDNLSGVSNAGPALPYLFGRGSTIYKDPDSSYSPREHGITVRAIAIAEAKRAMSVGKRPEFPPEVEELEIPGALPIVLAFEVWQAAISDDGGLENEDENLNQIEIDLDPDDATFLTVGGQLRKGKVIDTNVTDGLGLALSVGQQVPVGQAAGDEFIAAMVDAAARRRVDEDTVQPYGFIGLYIEQSGEWIVGFGMVDVEVTATGFRITPIGNQNIATRNAQASPSHAWEAPNDVVTGIWEAHRSIDPPLLAPALVR